MFKVKICGLKTTENVRCVIECQADYAGFVLWPGSKRFVTLNELRRLNSEVDFGGTTKRVGVFVNPEAALVRQCFLENLIDIAQFHGHESIEFLRQFPAKQVWKALRQEDELLDYPADALVVDGFSAGGGECCNWQWAANVTRKVKHKIFLAGGINLENCAAAVAAVQPYGVDLASGVETAPGVKSNQKINEFFRRIRSW
ncbi:MAG: phosphoribosylanthranilate isomerase [Victivallaceae bacterium]